MPTLSTVNGAVKANNDGRPLGIAEHILKLALVTELQLQRALDYQKQLGGRIEHILVNLGILQKDELADIYASYLKLPVFESLAEHSELDIEFLNTFDLDASFKAGALPFLMADDQLHLAVIDPFVLEVYNLWPESIYNLSIHLCKQSQLDALRAQLLAKKVSEQHQMQDTGSELERLRELAYGAPTVNLVNSLIVRGIKMRASDMHIEPLSGRYRVRYRVDGILHQSDTIPLDLQLGVVSRIKILAGMDIAERRKPQDGKIETSVAGKELDIRVSSLPLGEGESMVMRFLLKESVNFSLEAVGYEDDLIELINQDLKRTTGVILMTGPTGSGKTTSLYSFLAKLNQPSVKIITLEDPIEYQLEGINQVQVNTDIGFDFSRGLRSIVRQDPDIIMVGEIRDQETARIAMQSSLTGHLVFSTVHTNDAPTTFTRLIDLGVEEFLLNASVISIMAQRLVRTICTHCKTTDENEALIIKHPDLQQMLAGFSATPDICVGKGCERCGGTGYLGRVAILEYLPNDYEIQSMPKDHNFLKSVREYRERKGLRTLKQDGLLKVLRGITTFDEVMRVAG
ncbi:GspE/PulE family protein [Rheinheimera sp. MMS21-TC3]|uniref:GspE/PulE family protein n=1 Tax=Rheinheimera sp. MMS21-TC3 TaxID=3072790 RepID=UPI0028C3B7A8|nr:ATPase, T2SS/T4P/T4SS family [Rheinheimera sp. MMS21-TC3]WNO61665.1 ATPase, T2SS/T4P/T4SS family [Rheinheimera sp. MMS21-TC3]